MRLQGTKNLGDRLKKSAGKMIGDVKDSLSRPNRRNSDAELIRDTPEKSVSSNTLTSSSDGKGSVREAFFRNLVV